MDINTVISLANEIEDALKSIGVNVVYTEPMDEGWTGEYFHSPYPSIAISEELSSEEVLTTLTHESIHYLQYNAGWLVGIHIKNPNLNEEENKFIEELVMSIPYYTEEDWELEFPAWKLETYPSYILKLLKAYSQIAKN